MLFGPQFEIATGSAGYALATDGVNVWLAWVSGTSVLVLKSTNQSYAFPAVGSAVTIDTNAANSDVQLNEPFNRDPVTGRLHLTWSRNTNNGSNPCVLMTSHSSDGGATWSTPVQLDDGTVHGNNRFYRCGVLAYNGIVEVVYSSVANSVFTADALWSVKSTDGGGTFTAPAKLYTTGVVCPSEPNAAIGDDGTAHISWFDPQVVANQGGDIYYAQGAWSAAGFQWQPAITQVTTGQTCGRSRVTASRGVIMMIANTNWGGSVADVGTVRSTDNGKTWGSVVTQATHTTNALDHPWMVLDGDNGAMIWDDLSNTPLTYGLKFTADGGATWTTGPTPLVTAVTSDAPKLITTNDLLVAFGSTTSGNLIYALYPLYSPAVPSSSVIDNFNRANENPLSNAGAWSVDALGGPSGQLKLVSNQVVRQQPDGTFDRAGSYRNDTTVIGGLGEVFVTVATADQGEMNLFLGDESTKNGYMLGVSVGDFGSGSVISRQDAAVGTTLQSAAINLTSGDKWLLRATPNDVVGYRFVAASSDWEEVFRVRDTTYRSDFRGALNIAGLGGQPALDDFGGSALVAPSNTVLPAATGTVGAGNVLTVGEGTWATAQGATPARYSYQWQTSPAGANTWTNIALGFLPFFTVVDATKDHRCIVTASNSYGVASADSNTLSAPADNAVANGALPLGGAAAGTVSDSAVSSAPIPLAGTAAAAVADTSSSAAPLPLAGAAAAAVSVGASSIDPLPLGGSATGTTGSEGSDSAASSASLPLAGAIAGAVSLSAVATGRVPIGGAIAATTPGGRGPIVDDPTRIDFVPLTTRLAFTSSTGALVFSVRITQGESRTFTLTLLGAGGAVQSLVDAAALTFSAWPKLDPTAKIIDNEDLAIVDAANGVASYTNGVDESAEPGIFACEARLVFADAGPIKFPGELVIEPSPTG